MQYFRITGLAEIGDIIDYKLTVRGSYSDTLIDAMRHALYCEYLEWDDFAEGMPPSIFNDLINSGEKTLEIQG